MTYSDTGLFGLQLEGHKSRKNEILQVLLYELKKLRDVKIPEEELLRAKNITKMNILLSLEQQEARLEEMARNYLTFKEMTFHRYCQQIDLITQEQISETVGKMLRQEPTMAVLGADKSTVMNVPMSDQVSHFLR